MIADALGHPLAFRLTGAQEADIHQAKPLLGAVEPPGAVIADRGYDADSLIEAIEDTGSEATIPPRRNRRSPRAWDRQRYRARHLIENLFARLEHFRRIATRHDKLDAHFSSFILIASIYIWLSS